jgi:hemolysin activation/secretion protein
MTAELGCPSLCWASSCDRRSAFHANRGVELRGWSTRLRARRRQNDSLQAALALCAALALWTGAAQAQTAVPAPSQVAPPVIHPAPAAPTRIVLPQVEAGTQAPPEAKKLTFVLIDVDIEGGFAELADTQRELVTPLIGRRISVADVFDLATSLQQAYVRAGYPLVRVVVPPQQLDKRARVKLRVVDGFIERIDAGSIAEPVRPHVLAMVASLIHQPHLTQGEIERRLLLAGETPGLILNAVFTAGKEIGGSVLVLTGRYRPVSASLYVDNAMPAVFGTVQGVATMAENGLAGLGEQLLVQTAGYPNRDFDTALPTRRYLRSVLTLPLGVDGWRLELAATDGRTTPHVPTPSAATFGFFEQAHVNVLYELLKRRDAEFTLNAMYEATDERIDTLALTPPVPLNLDRTRVVRGGFEGVWRERTSATTVIYGAQISRGLDALGARTIADASPLLPLSRDGADAVFTKAVGHVEVDQSLPYDFMLAAIAYGQTSFGRPLLTSEQFDITGAKMLSGFTAGELPGDTAWATRAELSHPFGIPVPDSKAALVLTPYLFAATGERTLAKPSVLEFGSVHASDIGAGVRLNLAGLPNEWPDAYAFVEWSRTHLDLTTPPTPNNGSRIFAGIQLQY